MRMIYEKKILKNNFVKKLNEFDFSSCYTQDDAFFGPDDS